MNPCLYFVLTFTVFYSSAKNFTTKYEKAETIMVTEEVDPVAKIDYKILKTPHHLFVGRCYPHYPVLHQEKIIFTSDGKSHVTAIIRMNIDEHVYITCVKVIDETTDGENGYPVYRGGGVGLSYMEFSVFTEYGKGFEFYVQIFGYSSEEEYKQINGKNSY